MYQNPEITWLMNWADRMVKKYGQPKEGYDWCRKLAYFMGEAGNYAPSQKALEVARFWELKNPEEDKP